MAIRKLYRDEWSSYFDSFSKTLMRDQRVDYAEIRVFSMEDGAQPETSWVPLRGITYDRKSDLLEIIVDRMDHLIYHPNEIHIDEMDDVLTSLEVLRRDGTQEVIELR